MSFDYLLDCSRVFLQVTQFLSCMYKCTQQQSCKCQKYSNCYDT